MTHEQLNEHDANQGAQSRGEFLGMTGNSAWCLLGSAGAGILLVIVFWGMLGFSLLACLGLGATLCAASVAYVFMLKNNRPAHYDSDFFESVLIESGLLPLAFGPGEERPPNPFRSEAIAVESHAAEPAKRVAATARGPHLAAKSVPANGVREPMSVENRPREKRRRDADEAPAVPLAAYERLRGDLNAAEDALEDALSGGEEDGVCV